METQLQITFRGMETSEFLEQDIRKKAEKLQEFFSSIISCHVVVEMHHKRHNQGNLFHVRLDILLPGKEVVVSRESVEDHAHEDPYVVVRDAFDAAKRQLQNYHEKLKGHVKTHETPSHGKIIRLFPNDNYGLIETNDKREIYFHRNSIINGDFDELEIGNTVRFSETDGDNGPRASTVQLEGKHHLV